MKRSELKEAIKAEIKSVLSEEIQVGDVVTLGGDGDELEVIDKRRMFGSDMMAYRVKFPDGNTEEYSGDQLRPARMMNEGKKGVVVDPDEIKFHLDQFYGGNIDGNDLANAIEEILSDMMKRSVSFSDIREGTWSVGTKEQIGNFIKDVEKIKIHYNDIVGDDEVYNGLDSAVFRAEEMMEMVAENKSDIREEDEPTDAEIKKADSVASAANKLQKLVKKMKDKAKDFKAAEGEAKEKIKDELKAMTAEKKKLEKSL